MFIRCIVVFSLGIKSFSGFFLHPTQIPVCEDRTEWLKRTKCQGYDQMSPKSTRRQKKGTLDFLNIYIFFNLRMVRNFYFVWYLDTDVPFEKSISNQGSSSMKTQVTLQLNVGVQKLLAELVALISKAAFSTTTKISWIVLERDKQQAAAEQFILNILSLDFFNLLLISHESFHYYVPNNRNLKPKMLFIFL